MEKKETINKFIEEAYTSEINIISKNLLYDLLSSYEFSYKVIKYSEKSGYQDDIKLAIERMSIDFGRNSKNLNLVVIKVSKFYHNSNS